MTDSHLDSMKALYASMSDSSLIHLLCAFKADHKKARLRDDGASMRFCETRMRLIEEAIKEHGAS